MFSDVDHEIQPVTSGARVTLVYTLTRSGRPRADAAGEAALSKLDKLAARLPMPARGPLMIACCAPGDHRGREPTAGCEVCAAPIRAIADLLIEHAFKVTVRSCVTAAFAYGLERSNRLTVTNVFSISRLSKSLVAKLIESLENLVTFSKLNKDDAETT